MAGGLKMLPYVAATAATFAAGPGWAQLADPTRPPTLAGMSGDAPAGVGAPAVDTGLQSVILKKDGRGRSAAVINGQVVQLGGWLGEARLVKVEEDHVILLSAEGRETLRLMPAAEKLYGKKVGAGATARPPESGG